MSQGHIHVRIADVADLVRGVTYDKSQSSVKPLPGLVPVLRATNIDQELTFDELVFVPASYVNEDQFVRPGDLIIAASSGSRSVVGKAAPVRSTWKGAFGAFCFALRPRAAVIEPFYLSSYLQTSEYRNEVSQLAAGVNINNLKRGHLEQMLIPVFPLAEQRRIVEAIESYFTRLDDTVATLGRVQRNLNRYRAAVLKAAVEGRLVPTEAEFARAEGRDYEPASALLERLLAERRRRWHTAGGQGKYQEPVAPDTKDLAELPQGWCWATADTLADLRGGITKGQKRRPADILREVPYLRVANVQRGRLDLSVMKKILATEAEIDELRLHPGDVLFNEGGDRDKLGRGWVWNGELPECIHQNHVFRARIFTRDLNPKLLSWYGNTAGQQYFFDQGKQTTNLASINLTKLRGLPVPIPPLAEQSRIVAETERLLSLVDEAELLANVSARRCARFRQSILKWAFEGKLADQDPSDEPASALLQRIRSQTSASRQSASDADVRSHDVRTLKNLR